MDLMTKHEGRTLSRGRITPRIWVSHDRPVRPRIMAEIQRLYPGLKILWDAKHKKYMCEYRGQLEPFISGWTGPIDERFLCALRLQDAKNYWTEKKFHYERTRNQECYEAAKALRQKTLAADIAKEIYSFLNPRAQIVVPR